VKVRTLGGVGRRLVCSAIGLGSLAFTGRYGRVDEAECIRTVRHALELGVTLLDTGGVAGGGDVERLERMLGRAIAGRGDAVVIAACAPKRDGPRLRRACDASLQRLGVDRIDLYYAPRADGPGPIEEIVSQLADLVAAGKIGHIGVSSASADQLRRAHAVHPITAIACEYSLWERGVEAGSMAVARELGVGIIACRPLGRGFLTGQVVRPDQIGADDDRRADPRFSPENLQRNRTVLRASAEMATQMHLSLGRLALAWLLSRGEDIVPIPSTRNPLHIEMNAAAVGLRLTREQSNRLAEFFPSTTLGAG
jgi:aryl-alcohol dehydrogenase-like predicted oxidoreductase